MGEALQGYDLKSEAFRVALENANIADKKFEPNIKKLGGVDKLKKVEKLKKIIKGGK